MRQLRLSLRQGQLNSSQVDRRQTEAGRVGLDDGGRAPFHQLLALPAQQLGQELPLSRVQPGQLTAVPGETPLITSLASHGQMVLTSVLPGPGVG